MTRQEYLDEVLSKLKRLEVNKVFAEGEIKPKSLLNKGGIIIKLTSSESSAITTVNIEEAYKGNYSTEDVAYTMAVRYEEAIEKEKAALRFMEYQKQQKENKGTPPIKEVSTETHLSPEEMQDRLNGLIKEASEMKNPFNNKPVLSNKQLAELNGLVKETNKTQNPLESKPNTQPVKDIPANKPEQAVENSPQNTTDEVDYILSHSEHPFDYSYEEIKKDIRLRLINKDDLTPEKKDNFRYFPITGDIYCVYELLIKTFEEKNPDAPKLDDMALVTLFPKKGYSASNEELYHVAMENMAKEVVVEKMTTYLFDKVDNSSDKKVQSDVTLGVRAVLQTEDCCAVISNTLNICGASSILVPNIRDMLKEKLGENTYGNGKFVVIPANVNELILMPESLYITKDKKELDELIIDINNKQPRQMVLSNKVYFFDFEKYQFMTYDKYLNDQIKEQKQEQEQPQISEEHTGIAIEEYDD